MKRFNIVTSKSYTKNNEEKKQWNNVGNLVYFPAKDGKDEFYILELSMFPETKFSVFPQEKKERELTEKPDNSFENYGIDTNGIPF